MMITVLSPNLGLALTHRVAMDGSQPFSQIQDAVSAAADGDTILVYPGRYIENVDFSGKNITIASLELITGNPSYRDSTIIDGNNSGSVVESLSTLQSAGIYGFTITRGSGSAITYYQGVQMNLGGGIAVHNASSFYVANCIIEHNRADWGGGLMLYRSTVYAKDTIIRDNWATIGGGIHLRNHGRIVFDQVDRCSVYNNTAGTGQDIIGTDTRLETNIYLDMATIYPTTDYFIFYSRSVPEGVWPGGFPVIDIQRGFTSEINLDIYVSPHGQDDNDGLSPSTPMRSIYRALQMVASDSQYPKTVHLAQGVYSTTEGQFFPIGMKPHVKILGDAEHWPILENLAYRETITGSRSHNATVENISIDYGDNDEGAQAISIGMSDQAKLKNIIILPHQSNTWKGIGLGSNTNYPVAVYVENVHISGQTSRFNAGLMLHTLDAEVRGLTIDDCHATGNLYESPYSIFYHRGNKLTIENSQIINSSLLNYNAAVVSIGMSRSDSNSRLIMNNVLVANNSSGSESPVFISAFTDSTSRISNSTFANNRGGYYAATLNGNLQVSNCIFDNDSPSEIRVENNNPDFTSSHTYNNNFIRGYPQSLSSVALNLISFNDIVLTGNPGFSSDLANDPLSYRLSNGSICRDMGTPDTTGLYLPEVDLYGNQRVFGSAIDIGCNEWSHPVSLEDHMIPIGLEVSAYPNPFVDGVSIGYNLDKAARVKLQIYNLKGQLVRTLVKNTQSKGEQLSVWEGTDDKGIEVSAGIYLIRLSVDDNPPGLSKLIKVK